MITFVATPTWQRELLRTLTELTSTLGEPLHQLQGRVRRLERQVFPGEEC